MKSREHYDDVFRTLGRVELQAGADLETLELPNLFAGGGRENRWLGFYTEEGLRLALERYGLWDDLAELGYHECRLETRCDDPDEHLLRIWCEIPLIEKVPLIELVVRREVLRPRAELAENMPDGIVGVLNVEWLQLQRPDAPFTRDRPPLPGQKYPGLGLGREILELLRQACKRIGLEGLVTVPSYFHNAYLYVPDFSYVDPREQGIFLAMCRDVIPESQGSFAAASWAVTLGMVTEEGSEEPFEWFHDVMLAPVSERLRLYAAANWYQREVAAALSRHGFHVFGKALEQELEARGISPLDTELVATWIDERV